MLTEPYKTLNHFKINDKWIVHLLHVNLGHTHFLDNGKMLMVADNQGYVLSIQ